MVAIEEEDQPHHPTTTRTTRSKEEEEKRRCYSVKICINKSPRGLASNKGTRNVPQQKEDSPCLPPLPPPILDDIPECVSWDPQLEPQNFSNEGCGKRSPKFKDGRKGMRSTRENYCQTVPCRQQHQACDPIWEVPVKPTSTYSEAGTQACAICPVTSESHAQTINKEVKHCGLQTSICERSSTTSCQTELERHCAAVGIPHDRKSCRKPCCIKEKVQERAISRNHEAPSPNCKLSLDYHGKNNVCASNCSCRARASCERKHPTTFPFIGRTPSGNFKVAPSMVSYENNEFGILVANPQSVRTTVRKLRSCQSASLPITSLEGCPKRLPPPNHRNGCCCCCREKACCIRQTQQKQDQCPSQLAPLRRTASDEGYKTPRGVSPPPAPPQPTPRQMYPASTERNDHDRWTHPHHQHHPHHDYNQNYQNYPATPELLTKVNEPVYEPPPQRHHHHHLMESHNHPLPPEKVNLSQNNDHGHVDRWNYVNPKYNNDYNSSKGAENRLVLPGGRQEEQRYSDQQQHARRTSLETEPPRNTPNPGFDNQLQTGLEKLQQLNEMKNTLDTYHQQYQAGNLTASEMPKHLEDIGQQNPFLKEHIDTGLQKWKQVNDMKDTYDKYYQNVQDVTAGFRPDAKQEPPKVVVTEHHEDNMPPPNRSPAVKHHRLDPEEDLYRHEEGHSHRHSPDTQQHHHQNRYNQHEQNRHIHENDHQHHQHHHHQHHPHEDKEYGQHHHHGHGHENPEKGNHPENRQMPRTGNTAQGQNREGWLSQELDLPEQIPVKAQETIFQIVVPDSDYQLTGTSESDPSGMEESPPTSPTEIMSKDEFQNNPGSKRKHSSGFLVTGDESHVGVLPNLDTQKGIVLLFGGINPKLPYGPGNSGRSVYMFTRETNKWIRVGLLPGPRAHFGLARVGHHVYLIGGTDPEQKDENGKNMAMSTIFRLDLRSGEWETVAELFKPRSHFGCVAVGHHIYIVGGNIDSRATKSCIVYSTVTHKEEPIAPLGITRSNMGITAYGVGVMIAGGTTKDPDRPVLETVTCYDPTRNRWTPWTNLPAPRAFCSLVVAKKQIYLVAGAGMRNWKKRGNSSLPDVLHYNEKADEWQDVGMLSTPRHGHTAVALVDDIIVIGGVSSHTMGALDSVEIFSPANGMCSIMKSLSQNKSGMVALAL